MSKTQSIKSYQEGDTQQKKALIDQLLLSLDEEDFYPFLEQMYLDNDYDAKKHSLEVFKQAPEKALLASKYLLSMRPPKDNSLNTLKYYGGRIIEALGTQLDFRITTPLLVAAYNPEDYRDACWSISMALSKIIMQPIELIFQGIDENQEAKDSLLSYLRSYTAIKIDFQYEQYLEEK